MGNETNCSTNPMATNPMNVIKINYYNMYNDGTMG